MRRCSQPSSISRIRESEGDPGEEDWSRVPGCSLLDRRQMCEQQSEQSAQNPGQRWVENEARLSRIEGRSESPLRMDISMAELPCDLHPVQQVEVEVVTAGAAVLDQLCDRDQCREWNEQE